MFPSEFFYGIGHSCNIVSSLCMGNIQSTQRAICKCANLPSQYRCHSIWFHKAEFLDPPCQHSESYFSVVPPNLINPQLVPWIQWHSRGARVGYCKAYGHIRCRWDRKCPWFELQAWSFLDFHLYLNAHFSWQGLQLCCHLRIARRHLSVVPWQMMRV